MAHRFSSFARRFASGMRRIVSLFFAAALLLLGAGALAGCDASGDEGSESGTAFLEGTVLDTSGDPVIDATVRVSPGGQTTETDSTGFYSLEVQIDSTRELTVSAEAENFPAGEVTITAVAGETKVVPDIELASTLNGVPTTVTGKVTTVEGTPPSDNARVVVTDGSVGGQTYSVPVDSADGTYSITPRIAGSTELTLEARSDEFTAQRVVTVFPEETRDDVAFVLGTGTFTASGRVVDGDDNPLEGVRVEVPTNAQTTGNQTFTTQTDAEGRYALDVGLSASTELTVRAVSDDLNAEQTVTGFPGEERTGVDLVLGGGSNSGGTVTLAGRVTSSEGDALDARVEAQPNAQTVSDQPVTTRTGDDGSYRFDVEITASTDLTVNATRDEREEEKTVTVFPDETREGLDFTLAAPDSGDGDGGGEEESGRPAYIELQSVDPQTIQVQETGGTEVSRLTFVVRDSAGRAISLDESRQMRFRFGSRPPSGDISEPEDDLQLLPEQAPTDDNGEATVNVNSGIVAGTAQVIAEVDGPNGVIESELVPITIHGGFPHREHFTVAVEQFNYAGLSVAGLENEVSVLVGDQYSNPVKPETAVYFETSGGVIEGDLLTDEQGRGAVQLISGNPQPENGIAIVTARTVNVDNEQITRQAAVVVSGVPNLTVTSSDGDPKQAQLGQSYTLEVVDQNGNPLAPGTNIQIRAEGNEVEVGGGDASEGDVDITLENTPLVDQNGDGDALDYEDVQRGVGRTEFSFKPVEDPNIEEEGVPTLTGLTITVTGPGGSASCSIDTSSDQTTCSTGAVTSATNSQRLVIEGQEPQR
jgi:protocatechuate 3,4-dioxygenase beta subunit